MYFFVWGFQIVMLTVVVLKTTLSAMRNLKGEKLITSNKYVDKRMLPLFQGQYFDRERIHLNI